LVKFNVKDKAKFDMDALTAAVNTEFDSFELVSGP